MKRIIYKLDEKLFSLIENSLESLNFIKEGVDIKTAIGKVFIHSNNLFDEASQLRVFIDKGDSLHSTYLFSVEYSTLVRNAILQKYDEMNTEWKEDNDKIESYLKENKEAEDKILSENLYNSIEDKIKMCIDWGTEKVVLHTTSKKDFNETLEFSHGLGVNDLKPVMSDIYMRLLIKYSKNLTVIPISLSERKLEFIYLNK